MKSIETLLVDWDRLKMREPRGMGKTYSEKHFFVVDQHSILTELFAAGCVQIPGEPLPISELLTLRIKLILDW